MMIYKLSARVQLAGLIFPVLFGLIAATAVPPGRLPKPRHRFVVIAHRGLHNEYPENSLASFKAGGRAGVDFVEMDLRTTKDSVLVILHDSRLDRTTDGKGSVDRWLYADLQKLTLKSEKNKFPEPVPTFEQALAVCRDKVYIYLDFKSASIPQTMTLIRKYGMENQVIVYINSPEQYKEWRQLEPQMPVMVSLPDSVRSAASLAPFLDRFPAELLDGDYTGYTKQMLAAAAKKNIAVWPDIQGKEEAGFWAQAVDTGFQGLQSDHPEALIRWLEKRGLR